MTRHTQGRAVLGLLLAASVACGGDDGSADSTSPSTGDAGGSTTSVSTAEPTSTSAPTDDTGASTGTGANEPTGSGDTAAPDCPEDTPAEGSEVTISLRNDRAEAIFVTSHFDCAEAHLRIDSNDDPAGRWPLDQCAPTCASIIADACACPEACMQPRLLRIEPGASHAIVWDGALWVDHELAADCNACGVAPDCLLGVTAPASMYLASAAASSAASDCTDEAGRPVACECADGEDSCLLVGNPADPGELGAQALLDYPRTTSLELVFDPK